MYGRNSMGWCSYVCIYLSIKFMIQCIQHGINLYLLPTSYIPISFVEFLSRRLLWIIKERLGRAGQGNDGPKCLLLVNYHDILNSYLQSIIQHFSVCTGTTNSDLPFFNSIK